MALVAGDGELSFEGSKSVPVVAGGSLSAPFWREPAYPAALLNGVWLRIRAEGENHPGAGRHYQSVLAQEEKGR